MYFNIQIYSNNPISSQNFVHPIYSHPHCIRLQNPLVDANIYILNQYVLYIATLQGHSTEAFDNHYCNHIKTSFDQQGYTIFIHTYISRLSSSLSWLTRCFRYANFCFKYLVSIVINVWEIDSYINRILTNHGIISECYLELLKCVMILKKEAIIFTLSPITYISGLLYGDPIEGWINVLVGYLDDISVLLKDIKYLSEFIKHKIDFDTSVVGSYVKNSSEQLDSIKSSIRYLVSYIEPILNILRYIKEKINTGGCLSIRIDDLGWEQKYLECARSVKIAISSLKYLQSYIDNSFHSIDLIESSVGILERHTSTLERINIGMRSLIPRAMYTLIHMLKASEYIKELQNTIGSLLNDLRGTVTLLYRHHTEDVPMSIKNKIDGLLGTIETYIKVGNDLVSGMSRAYYFNKHNINQLKVLTGSIDFIISKIRKVIDGFDVSNKHNIRNLELWFKYMLKKFTGCSLTSTIKILKDSKNTTGRTGNTSLSDSIKTISQDKHIPPQTKNHGDLAWALLSHMFMMEPENVLVKLYECDRNKEKIDKILKEARCYCATYFNCLDKPNCMKEMWSHQIITQTLYESKKDDIVNGDQNRICLCLVITYHVYPKFVKLYSLVIGIIRDLSSCSSRNFDKHNKSHTFDLHRSQLALFLIQLIGKLVVVIKERYLTLFLINPYGSFHCYCISPDDSYYSYFICIMIYICSLLENTPECEERIEFNIPHIIHLLSDLEAIDLMIGKKNHDTERQTVSTSQNREKNKAKPSVKIEFEPFKRGRKYYYMTTGTKYSNQTNLTFGDLDKSNELGTTHKLRLTIKYNIVNREHFGVTVSFPITDKEKFCERIKVFSGSLCSGSGGRSRTSSNGGTCKHCQGCVILKPSLNLFYRNRESILMQISDNSILSFLVELEYRFAELKTLYYIIEKILNECKRITVTSKNNRMCDSTSGIRRKGFEGASNNHYSYNDAYRINTSRAHGSLKYIIIKIVLILIIVVMTIFIRVKIETDDYKTTDLLGEENGMCECDENYSMMKGITLTIKEIPLTKLSDSILSVPKDSKEWIFNCSIPICIASYNLIFCKFDDS